MALRLLKRSLALGSSAGSAGCPKPNSPRTSRKNMQDLDWLAAATTRHQQVVSAIAQAADILPARFGIEFLE